MIYYAKRGGDGKVTKDKLTVRMPPELSHILNEKAKRLGYTKNALIVQALWDYVKKQDEKKPA